ncbi:MAG TPA: hypothetical protein VF746_13370 [Longimicrobium sp.]|jgi:hypothetical protein
MIFKTGRLFVGGYDLTNGLQRISLGATLDEKETSHAGSAGMRQSDAGIEQAEFSCGLLYSDNNVDAPGDALFALQGDAGVPLAFALGSAAAGDLAWLFLSTAFRAPKDLRVGEPATITAEGRSSSGPLVRGRVMLNLTRSVTGATNNGTAVNLGAALSSQRVYLVVHVGAASAALATTFKLQSAPASNFASPTDRVTLTPAGPNGAAWGSLAGPVTDTWWRVVDTVTGSAPTVPLFVAAGIR